MCRIFLPYLHQYSISVSAQEGRHAVFLSGLERSPGQKYAEESANENDSTGLRKEKNRRASREPLGIIMTKRPLRSRKAEFGFDRKDAIIHDRIISRS
jgi:hypothetical protein